MPQSLHRTWAALTVATLAVLVVAFLAGRDFVRDVNAPCPGNLFEHAIDASSDYSNAALDLVPFTTLDPTVPAPVTMGREFQLVYDGKHLGLPTSQPSSGYGTPTQFTNVRFLWREAGGETGCTCGAVPIALLGEAPSDLQLLRVRGTNQYVVQRHSDAAPMHEDRELRAIFTIEPGRAHYVQTNRIFARQHLALGVVLVALGALVVAFLRSRRAMAYALRINTWAEARLTYAGLIESETGAALGTLEQTRERGVPVGPVLIAPEALATSGLYRDMPIITRRHIAEGTHARWAAGTMLRLRDARALAVISTACTLLAFGARLIA